MQVAILTSAPNKYIQSINTNAVHGEGQKRKKYTVIKSSKIFSLTYMSKSSKNGIWFSEQF